LVNDNFPICAFGLATLRCFCTPDGLRAPQI
jgi:hypothetical protein